MLPPTRLRSFARSEHAAAARCFVIALILAQPVILSLAAPAQAAPPDANSPANPGRSALAIVSRCLFQEQGGWRVEYRLRYQGDSGMIVTPTDVRANVESWVSNSRVAAHALPRFSSVAVSGSETLTGTADVIVSASDSHRCRERVTLLVWNDDPRDDDAPPAPILGASTTPAEPEAPRKILCVAPGSIIRVRVKLDHLHVVYGDYDPLLGSRDLELSLGEAVLRDAIPLEREQYVAQAKGTWPEPPEERKDTRMSISGPDSLHLEAHVPGNQFYRFPERAVRYGTKMRLSYWYYIAEGTEGECRARLAQSKDTPTAWKILNEGSHEECLKQVGRWVKVERVFRTEPEATTIALDFRVTSATDVGEMWIDDVSLEPICARAEPRP